MDTLCSIGGFDIAAYAFGYCGLLAAGVGLLLWRGAQAQADFWHDKYLETVPGVVSLKAWRDSREA